MEEGKRSVGDIARDLDIHPNLLHQWRRKYRADMEQPFPGKGHSILLSFHETCVAFSFLCVK